MTSSRVSIRAQKEADVVFSRRPGSHSALGSFRAFTVDKGVTLFLFSFVILAMQGKGKNKNGVELFAYLDGPAFEFYFANFTIDGAIREDGKNLQRLKLCLWRRFLEESSSKT